LLGVDNSDLEKRLCTKSRSISGKEIVSPFNKKECVVSRDSLAKYLYYHLFGWIVGKLNETIQPSKY
jgi:myosin heavy subunit